MTPFRAPGRTTPGLALVVLAGMALWTTGVPAGETPSPFADGASAQPGLEEEDRVWAEGDQAERGLIRSGSLHPDSGLSDYLQSVLERLFPEFRGRVRVRVINDTGLNAFCMPNGAIFFNMGLLARLDNEAQLATILAHEGIHFTHRHAYQSLQGAKTNAGFATLLGMVGGNTGALLGSLAAVSSISGFSRDLERQADAEGFQRLVRAGYDAGESVKAFRLLAEEVQVLDIREPYFFASHPRLRERIESFEQLITGHPTPGALRNEASFSSHVAPLREEWLQAQLAEGKPRSIIHVLTQPDQLDRFPPHAAFYLGEAYRLRDEAGDSERAEAAWQQVLARAPDFAPTHRALGINAMKRGETGVARNHFRAYLRLAPGGRDAGYVRAYLQDLEDKP